MVRCCILFRGRLRGRCAPGTLAKRVLEVEGNAMFPEDVGERLVRELLNGRHPVAAELLQFIEGFVVEGDQLTHPSSLLRQQPHRRGRCFYRRPPPSRKRCESKLEFKDAHGVAYQFPLKPKLYVDACVWLLGANYRRSRKM